MPLPSFSMSCMALCSCSPHSHLMDPNISPVMHDECTLQRIGSSGCHDPLTRAICSRLLDSCLNGVR